MSAPGCKARGPHGQCCKHAGHDGSHLRPVLTWSEWGAICGQLANTGPAGQPVACAYADGHKGRHSFVAPRKRKASA